MNDYWNLLIYADLLMVSANLMVNYFASPIINAPGRYVYDSPNPNAGKNQELIVIWTKKPFIKIYRILTETSWQKSE